MTCDDCGKPLPVDEHGRTRYRCSLRLYRNRNGFPINHKLCPDCYKAELDDQTTHAKGKGLHDERQVG